jgi:DNA-binding ferritin-like protein
MKDLIKHLDAIRNTAKDLHYHATGASFYAVHLLADRIQEPIISFIDDLKEICFLGLEKEVPLSNSLVPSLPPADTEEAMISTVYSQLTLALYTIEELSKQPLMQAEVSLLGRIAEHLQQSRGLLWKMTQTNEVKQ